MRTIEEMQAAVDAHNAKQDKSFLSKLVREIAAEIDAEKRAREDSK